VASPRELTVVFDLGGVLIDWNPRYLYRKLFSNEALMEEFLASVCNQAWNECQDAGRPWSEATAELVARFPEQEALVRAYHERWDEMLGGCIDGTVAVVEELHAAGVPMYALTNWSSETFHHARRRFPVLDRFRGIVVSGEEKVIKPDEKIFRVLFDRHGIDPYASVFIDDVDRNVAAARALGMTGIRFESPAQLRQELARLGLLERA
jgi:2-haloacid dehalogenase